MIPWPLIGSILAMSCIGDCSPPAKICRVPCLKVILSDVIVLEAPQSITSIVLLSLVRRPLGLVAKTWHRYSILGPLWSTLCILRYPLVSECLWSCQCSTMLVFLTKELSLGFFTCYGIGCKKVKFERVDSLLFSCADFQSSNTSLFCCLFLCANFCYSGTSFVRWWYRICWFWLDASPPSCLGEAHFNVVGKYHESRKNHPLLWIAN